MSLVQLGEWTAGVSLLAGGAFALLGALGIVRLSDFYLRLHAATKVSTLALGLLVLAFVVRFGTLGAAAQAFVLVFFVFLTAPVVAHVLAGTAFRTGVAFQEGTEGVSESGHAPMEGPSGGNEEVPDSETEEVRKRRAGNNEQAE